ncbi:MAG TPA: FAD binding domain-containing protein, partial [Thermomicrobiales bacterium]|nr:FAD binding domain-containing protein [Thermomicrobiales bacterium]
GGCLAMLQHVFVPQDVGDAVARLAAAPDAALLAGGTLLMPALNTTPTDIQTLVSARRLGLAGIEVAAGRATAGAATTLAAFGREPRLAVLRPVVESIAAPPIRNLATVGGNLFARQPYGDLAVALLALDATVAILGPNGARQAPVAAVLAGGGAPGEIVTSVAFDVPAPGTWFYTKAMRRKLNSAAIVTVAASIAVADGTVGAARIALGGAGPRPIRARAAEAALVGRPLDAAAVNEAAARAVDDAQPFTDAYASAWYRARVLPVHFRRAILDE